MPIRTLEVPGKRTSTQNVSFWCARNNSQCVSHMHDDDVAKLCRKILPELNATLDVLRFRDAQS